MRISKLLLRNVGEAEIIPRGYGLAYWDYCMNEGIFFLMPFNLIARLAVYIYWQIVHGLFFSKYEKMIIKARHDGYREGYATANKWIDDYMEKRFGDLYKEVKWKR